MSKPINNDITSKSVVFFDYVVPYWGITISILFSNDKVMPVRS